jgi:hypothetical protein
VAIDEIARLVDGLNPRDVGRRLRVTGQQVVALRFAGAQLPTASSAGTRE